MMTAAPLYRTIYPLILASASPRRQAFFSDLGLEITVHPADCDESLLPDERPEQYVRRLAEQKAIQVGRQFPGAYVIAADTSVVLDDRILGKPDSDEDAVGMLMSLAGRSHRVFTGFALFCRERDVAMVSHVSTTVTFTDFGESLAAAYVRTGEPRDKAGAYGIQGRGGVLVKDISGSYSNVVGLPLVEVVSVLLNHGIIEIC